MKTTALNYSTQEIKRQAAQIFKVWKANREFRINDAEFKDFEKLYVEFDALFNKIEAGYRELVELDKIRDKTAAKLIGLTVRARGAMRGYYGPKSLQAAQIKVDWSKKESPAAKPASKKSG